MISYKNTMQECTFKLKDFFFFANAGRQFQHNVQVNILANVWHTCSVFSLTVITLYENHIFGSSVDRYSISTHQTNSRHIVNKRISDWMPFLLPIFCSIEREVRLILIVYFYFVYQL